MIFVKKILKFFLKYKKYIYSFLSMWKLTLGTYLLGTILPNFHSSMWAQDKFLENLKFRSLGLSSLVHVIPFQ
jgi:hypothetical protein